MPHVSIRKKKLIVNLFKNNETYDVEMCSDESSSSSSSDSESELEIDYDSGVHDDDLMSELIEHVLFKECNKRTLSTLIFTILRRFGLSFKAIDSFFYKFYLLTGKQSRANLIKFFNSGFLDGRGGCFNFF